MVHLVVVTIFITDTHDHVFSHIRSKKHFLGGGGGELRWPADITVDSNDILYVSEAGNERVSVFTYEGQFITSFGRKGEGPGEFYGPYGLAVDNCGVVYVCNCGNNRIQCF